jgi:hypothetical protein
MMKYICWWSILLCCVHVHNTFAAISISDYGARANINSNLQAQVNARAFMKALDVVNAPNNTDRTLLVPAYGTYLMTQVNATNLYNVSIVVRPRWHCIQNAHFR